MASEIPKLRYMTGRQLTMPLVLRGANGSGGLGSGSQHGQSVENWAMCGLVPLDAAAVLASAARTGRLVIVEENPGLLGWGASIAAIVAEEAFGDLAAPVTRVSGGNVPLPVAASLEAEVDVSVPRVAGAVRAQLGQARDESSSYQHER